MDEKAGVEINSMGSIAVATFKAASISNVEEIKTVSKQINEFIEKSRPKRVVVDFERVKFFSSGVFGVLLCARSKVHTYGGEVVISAINPQLHRVFKITNLDKIFRFFPDKQTAVKAMSTENTK